MTTNEKKAKEIAIDYADVELSPKTTIYEACLEITQWKDEQFKAEKQALIDRGCEWLRDNMYAGTSGQMLSKKPYPFMRDFVEDFKKAMEENK